MRRSSEQVPCPFQYIRGPSRLTLPSSGRSKGRYAPFGPPLMSNVRPQNRTTGSHTMSTQHHRVTLVSLPPESRIAKAYASTNLADAYSIHLPSGASTNPELLARFIFSHQAPWVSSLIAFRDAIVGRLGLKTAKQQ